MPRGIPKKAVRTVRRGRRKSYINDVKEPVKVRKTRGRKASDTAPKTRVSAKNVVTKKFDELAPMLEQIQKTQELILKSLDMQFAFHKAGMLDAWRQYVEHMARNEMTADPIEFLDSFIESAAIAGVTVKDLQEGIKSALKAVPTNLAAPAAPPPAAPATPAAPVSAPVSAPEGLSVVTAEGPSGLNIL